MSQPMTADAVPLDPAAALDRALGSRDADRKLKEAADAAAVVRMRAAVDPLYLAVVAALEARRPLVRNREYAKGDTVVATVGLKPVYYAEADDVDFTILLPELEGGSYYGIRFSFVPKTGIYLVRLNRQYRSYDPNPEETKAFTHWVPAFEYGLRRFADFVVGFAPPPDSPTPPAEEPTGKRKARQKPDKKSL